MGSDHGGEDDEAVGDVVEEDEEGVGEEEHFRDVDAPDRAVVEGALEPLLHSIFRASACLECTCLGVRMGDNLSKLLTLHVFVTTTGVEVSDTQLARDSSKVRRDWGGNQLRKVLTEEKVAEKFVDMLLSLRPREQIRSDLQVISCYWGPTIR